MKKLRFLLLIIICFFSHCILAQALECQYKLRRGSSYVTYVYNVDSSNNYTVTRENVNDGKRVRVNGDFSDYLDTCPPALYVDDSGLLGDDTLIMVYPQPALNTVKAEYMREFSCEYDGYILYFKSDGSITASNDKTNLPIVVKEETFKNVNSCPEDIYIDDSNRDGTERIYIYGTKKDNTSEHKEINTDFNFCLDSSAIWQFGGYALLVIKILVPLVIILFGIIDMVKAITSNDDKAITLSLSSLVKRLIVGVAIFFVPTIISFVFSMIKDAATFLRRGEVCQVCLLRPTSDECDDYKEQAKAEREERNNN